MTETTDAQSTVVRTSRGLTITGTRITLYTVLDYLHAGWPSKLIQDWLNLTDSQMADVLAYIEAHRAEVEDEYRRVVRQAEEIRQYWDVRNRDRFEHGTATSLTSDQAALRAKLRAWKEKLGQA